MNWHFSICIYTYNENDIDASKQGLKKENCLFRRMSVFRTFLSVCGPGRMKGKQLVWFLKFHQLAKFPK